MSNKHPTPVFIHNIHNINTLKGSKQNQNQTPSLLEGVQRLQTTTHPIYMSIKEKETHMAQNNERVSDSNNPIPTNTRTMDSQRTSDGSDKQNAYIC